MPDPTPTCLKVFRVKTPETKGGTFGFVGNPEQFEHYLVEFDIPGAAPSQAANADSGSRGQGAVPAYWTDWGGLKLMRKEVSQTPDPRMFTVRCVYPSAH